MDIMEVLLILLCVAAVIALWLDGMGAWEAAVAAGRAACRRAGVQFLDDTVVIVGFRLGRNARGRAAIRRVYRFEFSDTGDNRLEGTVVALGKTVESVEVAASRCTARPDASLHRAHFLPAAAEGKPHTAMVMESKIMSSIPVDVLMKIEAHRPDLVSVIHDLMTINDAGALQVLEARLAADYLSGTDALTPEETLKLSACCTGRR
ncbi:MAG TPA: hypothetical protein DEP05_07070, partial [Betaproteobacteria bacterium]|nr:hypothetical protein [Betaproteobacteria bacterium]